MTEAACSRRLARNQGQPINYTWMRRQYEHAIRPKTPISKPSEPMEQPMIGAILDPALGVSRLDGGRYRHPSS